MSSLPRYKTKSKFGAKKRSVQPLGVSLRKSVEVESKPTIFKPIEDPYSNQMEESQKLKIFKKAKEIIKMSHVPTKHKKNSSIKSLEKIEVSQATINQSIQKKLLDNFTPYGSIQRQPEVFWSAKAGKHNASHQTLSAD